MLRGPFVRRLLEVLFDGKPEAEEDVTTAIARYKEAVAVERKRLVTPPEAAVGRQAGGEVQGEEPRRRSPCRRRARTPSFDFGEWKSSVASRKNDDGTFSIFTIDPGHRRASSSSSASRTASAR